MVLLHNLQRILVQYTSVNSCKTVIIAAKIHTDPQQVGHSCVMHFLEVASQATCSTKDLTQYLETCVLLKCMCSSDMHGYIGTYTLWSHSYQNYTKTIPAKIMLWAFPCHLNQINNVHTHQCQGLK